MSSPSETQGLDLLFRKLGHDIAEIRCRALDNILSKLEHGLIHDADIVQERQLMVRLLEWFNFQPSPKQDNALQLLSRLSKHSAACDLLVTVGAVPFLSRLRSDIDSNLRPQIDYVIDKLLHVTDRDLLRASSASRRCVYGRNKTRQEQEPASSREEHINYGYFTTQDENGTDEASSTITPPILMVNEMRTEAMKQCTPDCIRFAGFPWHSLTGTDRHVLASTGASLCSPSAHLVKNACAFLLDVIFRDFPPEIFLQRPSIVQTLLTLISSRPGGQLMTGALVCLEALAEGLISRVHFFQDPTMYCPRQGLPFHSDGRAGSHLSAIESFSESDLASRSDGEGAVRLERSGGDGRDDRSSSTSATNSTQATSLHHSRDAFQHGLGFSSLTWNSSDIDDESENDIVTLQRAQITAPSLCLSSLIATLPSLKTESTHLALNLLKASFPLVHLLSCSIRPDKVWTDNSTLAQSLQVQVRQLLETAGDALLYHYNLDNGVVSSTSNLTQYNWLSKQWPKHEAKMHRLVYQAMTSLLIKLLQAVMPIEQSANEVKSSVSQALFVIACDEALCMSCTDDYEVAQAYLEQCSPDKFDAVSHTKKVVNSFTHTHMFLRDYKDSDNEIVTMELIELAESSMDGLPYHSDVIHLQRIVRAISRVFINSHNPTEDANQLQVVSKRILLRLMAHPLVAIRRTVYDECLRIVRTGINVTAAAENSGHTASHVARFVLDTEVLYELCCHGLGDSSRLVSHPAQELITLLLQGRLLVAPDVWDDFCATVKPVLPVLQAYTGETEILQSAVSMFISPNEHVVEDWCVDCLCGCLRGLMLKHRSSRSAAAARLLKTLSNDDSVHITGLTDLLVVDTPLSLIPRDEADCFRIRRCVFQEEAVVRMLSVFRSTSTEASVRIGALRQLATMLDDPGLHSAFLNNHGLDSVADKLKELVKTDVTVLTDDAKPALGSCIMIMKLLLRRDAVSRERLSHDKVLLISLLRAADLSRLSVASLTEISVVIALLVFHDALREYKRLKTEDTKTSDANKCKMTELSLPASVATRYQIPFLSPTHHAVSIYRTLVCPPSPSCDPLIHGPPAVALRMAWNIARSDGNVIGLCEENEDLQKNDNPDDILDLRLTEEDRLCLIFSNPIALSECLMNAIVSSQSHAAASYAFSLLRIAMMSSPSSLSIAKAILSSGCEKWKEAMGKFLQVAPSCYEDEVLLTNLAGFLDEIIGVVETKSLNISDEATKQFVQWLLEDCILSSSKAQQMIGHGGSPILKILESSEPQAESVAAATTNEAHVSSVAIRRQLCKRILSLLSRTARMLRNHKDITACARFHRELRTVILVRLRLADAPQFYDLPSMEVTLECLVHISATRIAHGTMQSEAVIDYTDKVLSQQLLGTLLEIVSAFHIGSGASSLSYMGKGVSRCATQCILHLVREMAILGISDWPNLLEYSVPRQNVADQQNVDKVGLEWLVPLWSARDPRTRFAGLAIALAASQTKEGSISLANGFQRCPGGLWNMVLCVVLDHSECSAVRKQACDLLCNMISHKFDAPDDCAHSWQGPVVQDEGTGATVNGLPALLALFHHAHVYEHISLTLSRYHSNTTICSPAFINNTTEAGRITTGTSVLSVAGSADSSNRSSMTPLTQPSVSNVFPSLSSTNKETSSSVPGNNGISSHVATDNQQQNGGALSPPPLTSLPDEWRALTSPSLVTSICHLLCNLLSIAPHDTVHSIMQLDVIHALNNLLDVGRIESLFTKLSFPSEVGSVNAAKKSRRTILARNLLHQHEMITRLFTMVVIAERSVTPRFLSSDESFVKNIVSAFSIEAIDNTWLDIIDGVHKSVANFISASLHQNIKNPLSTAFVREWHIIYAGVSRILSDSISLELHTECMRMLALLFRSESVTRNMHQTSSINLTWIIEKAKGASCDAQCLTTTLIGIFEILISKPSAGIHGSETDRLSSASHALLNLFACSQHAQDKAMEMGFLERCLSELKQLHLRMTLHFTTSLANKASTLLANDSKSQSTAMENCDAYIQPILRLVSLLNNLLHEHIDAKKHAAKSGLGQVLSQLWSWTSSFPSLQICLLRLAVTFTANCDQACSRLACSHSGGQPSVATSLVKTCRDVHGMVLSRSKLSAPVLHLTFNALVNCASASECRALIWKMNLLELFSTAADRGQHPKRSRQQGALLEHWLRLLLSLSFHTDGQLNILKIRDIFDILIELYGSNTCSKLVALIIRNLCFHAPSKHRISSNAPLVRLLMDGLNKKEPESHMVVSSAILSLLCNSQKAKVHLKGAGLSQNVQNALARLTLSSGRVPVDSPYKKSLTTMLEIMQR